MVTNERKTHTGEEGAVWKEAGQVEKKKENQGWLERKGKVTCHEELKYANGTAGQNV